MITVVACKAKKRASLRGASHERKEGGRQEHLLKMIGSGG